MPSADVCLSCGDRLGACLRFGRGRVADEQDGSERSREGDDRGDLERCLEAVDEEEDAEHRERDEKHLRSRAREGRVADWAAARLLAAKGGAQERVWGLGQQRSFLPGGWN